MAIDERFKSAQVSVQKILFPDIDSNDRRGGCHGRQVNGVDILAPCDL